MVGGAIGGPGALSGWAELSRLELEWTRDDVDAARSALADVPVSFGVWGFDVGAWRALWAARLGSVPAPDEANLAALARHPDRALGGAIELEISARKVAPSDGRGAAELFGAAAAAWRGVGRPYEECRVLMDEARAWLAVQERAAARAPLQAAATLATELGAVPLLAMAEGIGARARMAVPHPRRPQPDPSEPTRREMDVLALLADGYTNAQIAGLLYLSPKTVGIHVSRILEKLDSHTRGEAVAVARRRALLS